MTCRLASAFWLSPCRAKGGMKMILIHYFRRRFIPAAAPMPALSDGDGNMRVGHERRGRVVWRSWARTGRDH